MLFSLNEFHVWRFAENMSRLGAVVVSLVDVTVLQTSLYADYDT